MKTHTSLLKACQTIDCATIDKSKNGTIIILAQRKDVRNREKTKE
jgi:hypothetical protein